MTKDQNNNINDLNTIKLREYQIVYCVVINENI